jgi:hypothetical protein
MVECQLPMLKVVGSSPIIRLYLNYLFMFLTTIAGLFIHNSWEVYFHHELLSEQR